uniref:Uncharacterized protein n=1 Tax=Ralstonia solanacearum TaxID=305 RepID=A0A0S4TWZ7_RALSL|nr:protein of unknown function [Ralstonia solanacearum]
MSSVELWLELFSEVDTLPLEADPALDAADVKLSAWAWKVTPATAARQARRKPREVCMVGSLRTVRNDAGLPCCRWCERQRQSARSGRPITNDRSVSR